jgi:RND family efflux transporter MFP subunit
LAAGTGLLLPGTSPGRADPVEKAAPPYAELTVVRPSRKATDEFRYFNGVVEAANTVDIRSRITSQLEKVAFQPGQTVKRGDLLFQLDSRAYEIELHRAQAEVEMAIGILTRVKAELDRTKQLEATGVVPAGSLAAAKGPVDEAQARVLVAKAGLERARLDLDATRITSPIDGRTGENVLSIGSLAAPTTTLAKVVAIDPIYVSFSVAENDLQKLRKLFQGGAAAVVEIALSGDNQYSIRAKIEFVDNQVNPGDGTVRVRASLPNPKGEILSGMSAHVRLKIGVAQEQLTVPESAVRYTRGGESFVLVAGPGDTVEWRPVTISGAGRQGQSIVVAGIGPEDRVITDRRLPLYGVSIRFREADGTESTHPPVRERR